MIPSFNVAVVDGTKRSQLIIEVFFVYIWLLIQKEAAMKRFFTLLFVLFCSAGIAQEPIFDNFYKQGDQVYWQVIDTTSMTFEELQNAVKLSGNYTNFDITKNQIICELKPFACDYKAYGLEMLTAKLEIAAFLYTGLAVFEKKDTRVRYTIRNIELLPNKDYIIPFKDKTTLSEWYNSYKSEFREEAFGAYSYIINDEFILKTEFKRSDANW